MILHHPITFQTFTALSVIFCQPIICQTVTAWLMYHPITIQTFTAWLLLLYHPVTFQTYTAWLIPQSPFKHLLLGWSCSIIQSLYCLVDHAQSSSHFSNTYCLVCHPFTFKHLLHGLSVSPSHLSNIMVNDTPSLNHLARAVATQNAVFFHFFISPLLLCPNCLAAGEMWECASWFFWH